MNKTTANHAKMKAKKRQQDILSSTDDHTTLITMGGLQKAYLNTVPFNQNGSFTSSRGVLKKTPKSSPFHMESMDQTDEWLIRSKADLTRTIGGVLDTVEHMHQEFRAFENSTQSDMNQHKQHIDNLEQGAMSILGAHGALDQKLEAMHNDLEEYKRQTS